METGDIGEKEAGEKEAAEKDAERKNVCAERPPDIDDALETSVKPKSTHPENGTKGVSAELDSATACSGSNIHITASAINRLRSTDVGVLSNSLKIIRSMRA